MEIPGLAELVGRLGWQGQDDGGAVTGPALDPDLTVHRGHQAARGVEPDPTPIGSEAARLGGSEELLECALARGCVHPDPLVADCDLGTRPATSIGSLMRVHRDSNGLS